MFRDIIIKNVRVIDPLRNIDDIGDIRIINDRMAELNAESITPKTQLIDAQGCIATPGLIDYHAHVFSDATEGGVRADLCMLPNGVTTVVDAGSAGTANFDAFYRQVICTSKVRIKAFIAASPAGQTSADENHNPDCFNAEKIKHFFSLYPDVLQGIKLKIQTETVLDYHLSPLIKALEIAEDIGCRIAVHTTKPIVPTGELVNYFRNGDIFAHAFHGFGSTIIGEDGHVLKEVKEARLRGVIFDVANGRSHFGTKTARHAIADGFYPDVISSDMSTITMLQWPVYGLPWILSKYLALGMELTDVIAASTSAPAALLGMEDEIGSLTPGSLADISLFKMKNKPAVFSDILGDDVSGDRLLVPQMTIKSGEVLFRQVDFGL